MPKFPNPPRDTIDRKHLVTAAAAAAQFGIGESTIRVWVRRGKIEPVFPGSGVRPALYHLPTLAAAERDAWRNGANRPNRNGRPPGWKPCTKTPAATAA